MDICFEVSFVNLLQVMAWHLWCAMPLPKPVLTKTADAKPALHRVSSYPVLPPRLNQHVHDDVIKWKSSPRYLPFVWGIQWSPVNSPHKDQWRGALMFYLICAWTNNWVNNRDAGDLRRHSTHYDVTLMLTITTTQISSKLIYSNQHFWQHSFIQI